MIMYHPESKYPIDVHPNRVEEMQRKGWTFDEPTKAKPKKAKSAIETLEENDNGES